MTATRLIPSPTLYEVLSDRLVCSSPMGSCGFNTTSPKHKAGDNCPRCEIKNPEFMGNRTLEPAKYTVDLQWYRGVGKCDCDDFAKNGLKGGWLAQQISSVLESLLPEERQRLVCKHIALCRVEMCRPENLDALLMAFEEQEQHT